MRIRCGDFGLLRPPFGGNASLDPPSALTRGPICRAPVHSPKPFPVKRPDLEGRGLLLCERGTERCERAADQSTGKEERRVKRTRV